MSDSIEKLVEEYQAVKASPYLVTRIEADVASRSNNRSWWFAPVVGASTLAVLASVVLGISMLSMTATQPTTASVPGFSALSSTLAETQAMSTTIAPTSVTPPSFANLRSINRPASPDKPVL